MSNMYYINIYIIYCIKYIHTEIWLIDTKCFAWLYKKGIFLSLWKIEQNDHL